MEEKNLIPLGKLLDTPLKKKYRYMVVWFEFMQRSDLDRELAKASELGAPENTIFIEGKNVQDSYTFDKVRNPDAKAYFNERGLY